MTDVSELREAAGRAMYEHDDAYDLPWEDQGERNGVREWYRKIADAALADLLDGPLRVIGRGRIQDVVGIKEDPEGGMRLMEVAALGVEDPTP